MPPLYDLTRFCRDLQTPFPKPIKIQFIPLNFLLFIKPKNPANYFSTLSIFTNTTALFHFKIKIMAEKETQFLLNEDEPMQTDPIYLSSDETSDMKKK